MVVYFCQLLTIIFFLGSMSVQKRELFNIWRSERLSSNKVNSVETYIYENIIDAKLYNELELIIIRKKISNFIAKLVEKWKACHSITKKFEEKNKSWLDEPLLLIKTPSTFGRPEKPFAECSRKTKLGKVTDIIDQSSCDELVAATTSSLYKAGKRSASALVGPVTNEGAEKKIKSCIESLSLAIIPYSPEEALAFYLDGDLTKHTYKLMQAGAKSRNANIYPTYDALLSAKKQCYPNGISIEDYSAHIPLQSMVNHIVTRIVESSSLEFQFDSTAEQDQKITAIYKWGCDGSSGHSTYRQGFLNENNNISDECLFAVCIVPLRIVKGSCLLWKNPRPSSTRYCRPLKMVFQKESAELVRLEVDRVNNEILKINPTNIKNFKIHHQFHLTMIDGKVFSALAESSSQVCGICKATPKQMNNIDILKALTPRTHLYKFGLSTLHAWIRSFECILHIAYRLPIKKWQIREDDKHVVKENKSRIQKEMKKEMSLLVDIPIATSGNTNNGNTARRFFQKPQLASKITGVNEELILRLNIILRSISCGSEINIPAFKKYTSETANLFVKEYHWFYMPSSLHKILMHGGDIISISPLPIGEMSEEALEARNKDFRNFREHHTRKTSRKNTMEDLVHSLLCSSDPLISSLRSIQKRLSDEKGENYFEDIAQLLCANNSSFKKN